MDPGPIKFYRSFADMQADTQAENPTSVASDDTNLLRAADHDAAPVEWLWPNRIPIGKVTLLVGDPGLGKSLIALDVASRVTRAAKWPDDPRGRVSPRLEDSSLGETAPRAGSVIILSAEDALDDTIRPRLDAAGANAYRIYFMPAIADLRHDMARLRDAVDRLDNCRLIVVDPINAYVGPSDSHFHIVVRRILEPLTQLAREKRLAVLTVAHLRKTHGAVIQRTAGSMGFVSNARAVWTVARDHTHPGRNLLLPLKHNLTAAACGLAYKIEPHAPTGAPLITWDPTPITTPADELLTPPTKPRKPSAERAAAHDFLRKVLAAGPRAARDIVIEGDSHGFLARTLRRAIHEIGGHVEKRGLAEGWWWSLTADAARDGAKCDLPDLAGCPIKSVPFEGDTPKEPTSGSPLSQVDPILQSILTPSVADSIAALDFSRLVRAQLETRRKQRDRNQKQNRPTPARAAPPPTRAPP